LERAGLDDKSAKGDKSDKGAKGVKACLIPRRRNGWLELYNQEEFKRIVDNPTDDWRNALDRLIVAWRSKQEQGHEQ
jgi:hypothetical protein